MGKADSLELEIVSDKEIEKLERIKELLAEIQQLKDEVFGKQENDFKKERITITFIPSL